MHAHNVTCPSQLMSGDGCGYTVDVGFLQYTDVGPPVFPTDLEDLAETPLEVLLQGHQMSAVGGPAVCPIEQSGQNYSLVDKEFCLGLDVSISQRLSSSAYSKNCACTLCGGGSRH